MPQRLNHPSTVLIRWGVRCRALPGAPYKSRVPQRRATAKRKLEPTSTETSNARPRTSQTYGFLSVRAALYMISRSPEMGNGNPASSTATRPPPSASGRVKVCANASASREISKKSPTASRMVTTRTSERTIQTAICHVGVARLRELLTRPTRDAIHRDRNHRAAGPRAPVLRISLGQHLDGTLRFSRVFNDACGPIDADP